MGYDGFFFINTLKWRNWIEWPTGLFGPCAFIATTELLFSRFVQAYFVVLRTFNSLSPNLSPEKVFCGPDSYCTCDPPASTSLVLRVISINHHANWSLLFLFEAYIYVLYVLSTWGVIRFIHVHRANEQMCSLTLIISQVELWVING